MLNGFVDEKWVAKIDENDLELIDKEFILKDFRDKEADIIYRLKLNNVDIIFYCLLELQSTKEAAEIFMKLKPGEQIDFIDWLKDVLSKKVSHDKKSVVNEMILSLEKGW